MGLSVGGAALGQGLEKHGHLRGRQRVREASKGRARVAVGGQSLMHDDGRMGSANANGGEPDGPAVPAATQKSLVDQAVQDRSRSLLHACAGSASATSRPVGSGSGRSHTMPSTRRSRSPSVTTPQAHSAHVHGSHEHIGLLHFVAVLITLLLIL